MNLKTSADWQKIYEMYDFKDKIVVNVGCSYGDFCFKVGETAKIVCGLDSNHTAIDKANLSATTNVKFNYFDINVDEICTECDIILLLDTLQYLQNPEQIFNKLFSKADSLLIEIWFTQHEEHWTMISKDKLFEIAEKYGHELKEEFDLDRGSIVMLFEKC